MRNLWIVLLSATLCLSVAATTPRADEDSTVSGKQLKLVLLDALKSPHPQVHRPAQEALTALGEQAIDTLLACLRSGDEQQAARAADVLGRIGDRRALPSLVHRFRASDQPDVQAAMMRAIARILQQGKDDPRLADKPHGDAAGAIGGEWISNWGPMSIEARREQGRILVTGDWDQGPGMHGKITSGSFDEQTGVLQFHFDEPWHNQTGTAELRMTEDGRALAGTWQFTTGGGGSWTMRRPSPGEK